MIHLRLIAAKSLFSRMLHFDLIKQIRFYIYYYMEDIVILKTEIRCYQLL